MILTIQHGSANYCFLSPDSSIARIGIAMVKAIWHDKFFLEVSSCIVSPRRDNSIPFLSKDTAHNLIHLILHTN